MSDSGSQSGSGSLFCLILSKKFDLIPNPTLSLHQAIMLSLPINISLALILPLGQSLALILTLSLRLSLTFSLRLNPMFESSSV